MAKGIKRHKWSARGPNKLLDVAVGQLYSDPLLGVLVLRSDEGVIDLAINAAIAEELVKAVQQFLAGRARKWAQPNESAGYSEGSGVMRVEISFYGHSPCPFCWPRKTIRRGTVLEISPGWVKMHLDGSPNGEWMSFYLRDGMAIKVLPSIDNRNGIT